MEGKYCMSVGMQLNVFHASKLSVWLNYVKSHMKKRNMNHGKHVTPEDVSMSTNLNICNILLHGIKNIIWQQSLPEIYLIWITNNRMLCMDILNAPTSWIVLCFLIVGVRIKIQKILADLLTHAAPPCLFYSSPICVVPMVPILVSSPWVLVKWICQVLCLV
jgi:hypothetical protein